MVMAMESFEVYWELALAHKYKQLSISITVVFSH